MKNNNTILWTFNNNKRQKEFFEFSIKSSFVVNQNNVDYSIVTEKDCFDFLNKLKAEIGIEKMNVIDIDNPLFSKHKNFAYVRKNYYLWFSIAPFLLEYEKISFFDNDVLINSDINSILSRYINDNSISGRTGGSWKWIKDETFEKFNLNINDLSSLCNGGVWLIDRKKYLEKFSLDILNVFEDVKVLTEFAKKKVKAKLTDEFFMFVNFQNSFKRLDNNLNILFADPPSKTLPLLEADENNIHFWMRGKKFKFGSVFLKEIKTESEDELVKHFKKLYSKHFKHVNHISEELDNGAIEKMAKKIIEVIHIVNTYWNNSAK